MKTEAIGEEIDEEARKPGPLSNQDQRCEVLFNDVALAREQQLQEVARLIHGAKCLEGGEGVPMIEENKQDLEDALCHLGQTGVDVVHA